LSFGAFGAVQSGRI